jgi:hypothetical protein
VVLGGSADAADLAAARVSRPEVPESVDVISVDLNSPDARGKCGEAVAAAKSAGRRIVVACPDGARATALVLGCHIMEE